MTAYAGVRVKLRHTRAIALTNCVYNAKANFQVRYQVRGGLRQIEKARVTFSDSDMPLPTYKQKAADLAH